MEWNVQERVHIMPVGFEFDRIIEPADRFRADKVVLIAHTEDEEDGEGQQKWNQVTDELDERGIEYEPAVCDIFDLYDSLGTIAEIISNHAEDSVHVNITTGSKVTAIAGMIASMVMDATPYYVRAKDYEDDPKDITDVTELPTYPINAPDIEQISVMEFIHTWNEHQGPPTKGETIHFSEREDLAYIRKNIAGKGKYRLLDTHIVEPLKERGWLAESKQGRNKVLELTEKGKDARQAFRWLIDEDIDWEVYLEEGLDEA